MANSLYDAARASFLTAGLNWSSDTIKAILVDTAIYTVNLSTHVFLSDVSGSAIVATSSAFSSKTTTGGAAGAANITFTAVSYAGNVGAIIIYKDTGSGATSNLIAFINTATGLPIAPNGGDIIVSWDTGTNKIFRL